MDTRNRHCRSRWWFWREVSLCFVTSVNRLRVLSEGKLYCLLMQRVSRVSGSHRPSPEQALFAAQHRAFSTNDKLCSLRDCLQPSPLLTTTTP